MLFTSVKEIEYENYDRLNLFSSKEASFSERDNTKLTVLNAYHFVYY